MSGGVGVPVLLFAGPIGVGKTTVAMEAARLLEEAGVARAVAEAVPGAAITVVGLRAGLGEVRMRIRARESGRDPAWYLESTARLVREMRGGEVEDHVVSNEDRSAASAAEEALRLVGWLGARS